MAEKYKYLEMLVSVLWDGDVTPEEMGEGPTNKNVEEANILTLEFWSILRHGVPYEGEEGWKEIYDHRFYNSFEIVMNSFPDDLDLPKKL